MALLQTFKFITGHPLNQGRKLSAVAGFLRWQVGTRLINGQIVHVWVNGSRFLVRRGENGLTGNLYCGLHEFPDMSYLLHSMSPHDLFVDIGSNVGAFTILACAAKGARGICIEPVPQTFERLMDNLRLNNLCSRVTPLNIGLADKDGELLFTTSENCMNHAVAEGESADNAIKVSIRTLDDVLTGENPSMLKVDVEGFETLVLRGGTATLNNPSLHSVIMELNGSGSRYGFSEDAIVQTMQSHGFDTYSYDPFSRTLTSMNGARNAIENTLFIRDIDQARQRVKAASEFTLGNRRV